MRRFHCICGQPVFFNNTRCLSCRRTLGFDPQRLMVISLANADGELLGHENTAFKRCGNGTQYEICNWLIPASSDERLCISCQLNRTIPNLESNENLDRWRKLETNKRQLIYGLLSLGLPVVSIAKDYPQGLAFDFVEDQRSNPQVDLKHVLTGHHAGIITIDVAEADDAYRVHRRKEFAELYRTLLGHFRHESGHYYFELLLDDRTKLTEFRDLFGDEGQDYDRALIEYYDKGPDVDWRQNYITAYASAHPLEDWAETWAHYLHIYDSLETAFEYGLLAEIPDDFTQRLCIWRDLTVALNELNRSMGVEDAYPFVLNAAVAEKLGFVNRLLQTPRFPNHNG